MEMTYRDPQTPLFPPSYENIVHTKDPLKKGESHSQHITNWDITVWIINVYIPNNCIMNDKKYE